MDTAGSALQASGRHAPPLCAPPLLGGPELPFAVRVSAQTTDHLGWADPGGWERGAGRPTAASPPLYVGCHQSMYNALDVNVS